MVGLCAVWKGGVSLGIVRFGAVRQGLLSINGKTKHKKDGKMSQV